MGPQLHLEEVVRSDENLNRKLQDCMKLEGNNKYSGLLSLG